MEIPRNVATPLGWIVVLVLCGWLGFAFGVPALFFLITLAIVGEGNRVLWAATFPLVVAAIGGVFYGVYLILPRENELPLLLFAFTAVTIVPGLIFYAAIRLRSYRALRATTLATK